MELALNLVWFFVCAVSLALWRQSIVRGRRSRRYCHPVQGVVALGFALVLLFSVISITDDLQASQVPMEEPAPSKVIRRMASCSSPSSLKIPHVSLGLASSTCIIYCRRSSGYALCAGLDVAASTPLPHFEIRGPPRW